MRLFIGGASGKLPGRVFFNHCNHILDRMPGKPHIVYTGSYQSVDKMIGWLARDRELSLTPIDARWKTDGVDAAYNRDRHIFSSVDYAIIFWDGFSRDVRFMLQMAARYKVKVKLVIFERED